LEGVKIHVVNHHEEVLKMQRIQIKKVVGIFFLSRKLLRGYDFRLGKTAM
jgi:hypothetical protein